MFTSAARVVLRDSAWAGNGSSPSSAFLEPSPQFAAFVSSRENYWTSSRGEHLCSSRTDAFLWNRTNLGHKIFCLIDWLDDMHDMQSWKNFTECRSLHKHLWKTFNFMYHKIIINTKVIDRSCNFPNQINYMKFTCMFRSFNFPPKLIQITWSVHNPHLLKSRINKNRE